MPKSSFQIQCDKFDKMYKFGVREPVQEDKSSLKGALKGSAFICLFSGIVFFSIFVKKKNNHMFVSNSVVCLMKIICFP